MPEYEVKTIGSERAKRALYEDKNLIVSDTGFAHVCLRVENFADVEAKCSAMNLEIL